MVELAGMSTWSSPPPTTRLKLASITSRAMLHVCYANSVQVNSTRLPPTNSPARYIEFLSLCTCACTCIFTNRKNYRWPLILKGSIAVSLLRDSSFLHSAWPCSTFFWSSVIFPSIPFSSLSDTSGKLACKTGKQLIYTFIIKCVNQPERYLLDYSIFS